MDLYTLAERVTKNEADIVWINDWLHRLKETDTTISLLIIAGLGAIAMLVFKNKGDK